MPPKSHPGLGRTALVVVACLLPGLLGCASTLKPIYPSSGVQASERTWDVRFSPDRVAIDEAGVPISTGTLWKRDVAQFAAERLNTLVGASDQGPVVDTRVVFSMNGPRGFQIGSWKELTITLSSRLPDGQIVQSEPLTQYIDNNYEYVASQVLLFGGPVFEVAAFALGMVIFTTGITSAYSAPVCACILALAFGGLFLNVAQAMAQWIISILEERRASDLFQEALKAHAADIERVLAGGPPPRPTSPNTAPGGPASQPPPPGVPPGLPPAGDDIPISPTAPPPPEEEPHPPPPLLEDPADDGEVLF